MVHTDTWRYEDGEHSATPPFSVLGVAAEPYMSHDRRARCNLVNVQKKGFTPINLYPETPGVIIFTVADS